MKKFHGWLLAIVKITGFLPAMIFFKPKITYEDKNGPKGSKVFKGPVMLVSNHKKLLDLPLYMMAFPFATFRFLIAEVMYNKGKLFSWFLDHIGGIEVDRNNFKFGFIAESTEVLDDGGTVAIFPAGRLPVDGKDFPFKPSVTMIAKQSGAPVIPVYTDGNYGLFKRTHIVVGKKMHVEDLKAEGTNEREIDDSLTKKLEQKVMSLAELIEKKE